MAGFFDHGVYLQRHSVSVREANKKYATSCNICCNRGFRVDCDRCPIAVSNEETIAVLRVLKTKSGRIGQKHRAEGVTA